ncbi:MAG: hypothetical protein PVG66_07610 [Chromatiales bacterium]|jgi:GGDEF domain-containing protein
MHTQTADPGKLLAIFLGSLMVVAVMAYLTGLFTPEAFVMPLQFDVYSVFIGLISGLVLSMAVTQIVLSEKLRARLLDEAINDPATGLFTRSYMERIVSRLVALHQRDPSNGFAMILLERVSDNLAEVVPGRANRLQLALAGLVTENIRETDFAVRFSDRRIAVFARCENLQGANVLLQRLRSMIARSPVRLGNVDHALFTRAALVFHRQDESLDALLARASDELDVTEPAQRQAA